MGYLNEFPHVKTWDSDLREILEMFMECKDLPTLYRELKEFVDNYFTDLDVQNEINSKLDAMYNSGELESMLQPFFNEIEKELRVTNARISTLVKLDDGEVEGYQEVVDGRVDYTGKEWDSIGDHVRGVNSQLSSEIVELDKIVKKGYLVKNFDWSTLETTAHPYGWMGGYYNEETGEAKTTNVHMRTNNIGVSFSEKVLYFDFIPPTEYRGMVSIYNKADDTYIEKIGDVIDGEFGTIRIINNPNYHYKFTIGRFDDNSAETKSKDKSFVDTIKLEYTIETVSFIESDLRALSVSIMSDSISSYDGYVPEGNATYYPKYDVTDVSKMWWSVMNSTLETKLLVNNSWSGSCCASGVRSDTTEASSDSRCNNLGDNPNIILACIGGNDFSYNCPLGDWNGASTPSDTTTFKEAYAVMLDKIQKNYPNSLIICVAPWYLQRGTDNGVTYINDLGLTESDYAKAVKEVADIFRLPFIDIASLCGFNRYNYYPTFCVDSETKPTHPNALGHKVIGETVAQEIVKICKGYFNYLQS